MRKNFILLFLLLFLAFILPVQAESNMSVEEVILYVPGVSREYTLLFLTDIHMVLPDRQADSRIQAYATERKKIFSSEEDFMVWISYANQKKVDALLLGGDILDFPSAYGRKYLSKNLDYLKSPCLYTPGNHDWTFPWEYMTAYGRENYLEKLAPYMQGNTSIHWLECKDFLVVAVDNSTNQIAEGALEQYRKLLQKGKPVFLLLHIPLYTDSLWQTVKGTWNSPVLLGKGNEGGIFPNAASTEFMELTMEPGSPVAAVFAGHVHTASDSMINEKIRQITGPPGYEGKALLLRIRSDL